jgi:hypothetical protein
VTVYPIQLRTRFTRSFEIHSAFGNSLFTYKSCWKWCPRASIKAWTHLILFANTFCKSAFGKSLCTYKRCWKWCSQTSIKAWTHLILFTNTFCRCAFGKWLCTYKRCWKGCPQASIKAWTHLILFGNTFCRSAFGKSLCTHKMCWKWCPRASIKAWTHLNLFTNTFCRSAFGKSLCTYKRCWKWCPRQLRSWQPNLCEQWLYERTVFYFTVNLQATYICICKHALKIPLDILIRYVDNKEVYCIFKAWCIISVLCSTECHLLHNFTFSICISVQLDVTIYRFIL